jgi:NAD-dependent deacetylase
MRMGARGNSLELTWIDHILRSEVASGVLPRNPFGYRSDMEIPVRLIESLRTARHLVVLTGAGISAESGLPTFRDKQTGLWERFKPEELATPRAFDRDPALVWGWYEWRRMKAARALPNPGHLAIKALEELVPRLTLITQNVDDLHERAGNRDVVHLHGTLTDPICASCKRPFVLSPEVPNEPEGGRRVEPPRCSQCQSHIRPGVVWFGESLPQREWSVAQQAAVECDVFACIGTSSLVYPAASLVRSPLDRRAVTIQINPSGTDLDARVTFDLRGPAGIVLPALVSGAFRKADDDSRKAVE